MTGLRPNCSFSSTSSIISYILVILFRQETILMMFLWKCSDEIREMRLIRCVLECIPVALFGSFQLFFFGVKGTLDDVLPWSGEKTI